MKKLSFYGLVGFFVFAGVNHFVNPEFYYPLIPDYLPYHYFLNIISGILEVGLGLLLLVRPYRNLAVAGLIALMILFVPSHIYFIQIGSCVSDGLCVPAWIAWIRLLLIHPLLILWIYSQRKERISGLV